MKRCFSFFKIAQGSSRFLMIMVIAIVLILTSLPLSHIQAATGDIDPTFGSDGVAFIDFKGRSDIPSALAIQPDGKIVLVGSSGLSPGGNGDFAVARINSNGSADTGFGNSGTILTDFGSDDEATSVILQPDGKFVVGGALNQIGTPARDFGLVRYNADGSPDRTFGKHGKVVTDFQGSELLLGLALQTDGKIIAVGGTVQGTRSGISFALARYNKDGSFDPSFGDGGKIITDIPGGDGQESNNLLKSVAIDLQGRIVVAGQHNGDVVVARYNSNGTLDSSFGNGGTVFSDFGTMFDQAEALLIQADGKILVAGGTLIFAAHAGIIARFNPDGTVDNSFGVNGQVSESFSGQNSIFYSLALQRDGKLLAAGAIASTDSIQELVLARYLTDGTLDPDFGVGGKITTHLGTLDTVGKGVALQTDGKIVIAAESFRQNTLRDYTVLRYSNDLPVLPQIMRVKYKASGKLTVEGNNFDLAARIFVDAISVTPRSNDTTSFVVKTLALSPGFHEVLIMNSDGNSSAAEFTVN